MLGHHISAYGGKKVLALQTIIWISCYGHKVTCKTTFHVQSLKSRSGHFKILHWASASYADVYSICGCLHSVLCTNTHYSYTIVTGDKGIIVALFLKERSRVFLILYNPIKSSFFFSSQRQSNTMECLANPTPVGSCWRQNKGILLGYAFCLLTTRWCSTLKKT